MESTFLPSGVSSLAATRMEEVPFFFYIHKSPQTLDTSNLVTLFPPPWIPSLEISGMLASSTLILAKGAGCGTLWKCLVFG